MPDLDGLTQALPTASAPAAGAPPAAAGRRPRGRGKLSRPASLGLNALSVVLGVAIWWALAASGLQLPTPAETASRGLELLRDGSLLDDVLASLRRVVLGFGLGCAAAVPIGFLMGWYPVARALLDPWVQFFRMIPPLALIPLAIVLLGIDETPKVFVIFLAAFLACVVAAYQGVVSVDRTLVNAGRVLGAGDLTLFRRVVIPASMPFILVGMRVGLGSSWATLVAAELIAAQQGLGYRMHNAQLYYDLPTIFVGIIAIGVLGLSMDRILQAVERRVTVWQERR